jgi:hypothetical protein
MTENRQNNQVGDAVTMQPRTLSSGQTFFIKFVFPIMLICVLGILTILIWLRSMQDTACTCNCIEPERKWLLLALLIFSSAFTLWTGAGLKKVRLDQEFLYISNYRREIRVPLNMVRSVTENRWINIHPVTIHFRAPTEFGEKVKFMPTARLGSFSSHPVVSELRKAAGIQENNITT